MQLYRWRGAARNFGDELNTLLWPRLLPGFFDDDPAEQFLGIGSVLDARHDAGAVKLVAGAGYGGYRGPANAGYELDHPLGPWPAARRDSSACRRPAVWAIPAMLLPGPCAGGRSIGFMPHFESLERGAWVEAAHVAGITLIDPRGDPAAILASIGACRVMLSEAMHGVIVADAMRVPWIALRPLAPIHRAKWHDWADALGLRIRFQLLAASSLAERLHASPLAASRRGRHLLHLAHPILHAAARRRFIEQAARSLAAAAASAPQLSTATALDRCRTRMLDRLDALRHDPWRPGNAPIG